jgi:hypothetical protein
MSKTFTTANDTNKWLVIADSLIGFYETKGEAENVFALLDDIESAPFGSAQMVPPGYRPTSYKGEDMTEFLASDSHHVDIARAIAKRNARWMRRATQQDRWMTTSRRRLASWREMAEVFGGDWREFHRRNPILVGSD